MYCVIFQNTHKHKTIQFCSRCHLFVTLGATVMPIKASEFVETHNNLQFQLCLRLLFWVSSKRNIIENKLTKMLIIKYEFMKLTTEKFNYDNVLLSVEYHIATYLIKHLKRCIQSNLEIPSKFTSFTGNILVNE